MATAKKSKQAEKEATAVIPAIKGFDKDLKCRGFQFEIGKSYDQAGKIEVCHNGFHAVTGSPFDVWNHYAIIDDAGNLNRWADVEMSGETNAETKDGDSKIASGSITIKAEIHLPELVKRGVQWLIASTKGKDDSGDYAQIGSSGDSAGIGSSGNYARIGSSGYSAQIGSSGDYARIGSSGNYAQIGSSGKNAVIAAAGPQTIVSAIEGAWISIAEFNSDGKCVGFATGCIGQDGLEPNVAYRAKGGKLVAA